MLGRQVIGLTVVLRMIDHVCCHGRHPVHRHEIFSLVPLDLDGLLQWFGLKVIQQDVTEHGVNEFQRNIESVKGGRMPGTGITNNNGGPLDSRRINMVRRTD